MKINPNCVMCGGHGGWMANDFDGSSRWQDCPECNAVMHRYYLTQRPPAPGTFPGRAFNVKSFDQRVLVPEIGRPAWGWVEYPEPLSEKDAKAYELVGPVVV